MQVLAGTFLKTNIFNKIRICTYTPDFEITGFVIKYFNSGLLNKGRNA